MSEWKLLDEPDENGYWRIRGTRLGGLWRIANCPFDEYSKEEARANAELIVKAHAEHAALLEVERAAKKPGFQGAPFESTGYIGRGYVAEPIQYSTTTVIVAREWWDGLQDALAALDEARKG